MRLSGMSRAQLRAQPPALPVLGCPVLSCTVLSCTVLALAACAAPAAAPASHPAAQGTTTATQATRAPSAPPGRAVPAGAARVTLALVPDANVRARPPQPAEVTQPAKVRQLAALINGLPPFPSGRYSCPLDAGARLALTFSGGRPGPALAVATVKLEGCAGVDLVTGGRREPGLGPVNGGRRTAARALQIAGLTWNLDHAQSSFTPGGPARGVR